MDDDIDDDDIQEDIAIFVGEVDVSVITLDLELTQSKLLDPASVVSIVLFVFLLISLLVFLSVCVAVEVVTTVEFVGSKRVNEGDHALRFERKLRHL